MARLLLLRGTSLSAAGMCMALLVDEFSLQPTFCSLRAGCDDVLQSTYGRPFGVPLSLVGLAAFGAFFALTLLPQAAASKLLTFFSFGAGSAGVLLVGLQSLALKQICPLCLLVDSAAILIAAIQLAWPGEPGPKPVQRPLAWAGLGILVLLLPVAWPAINPTPAAPPEMRAMWRSDKINVVEITDFTCPYCRQTESALEAFRKKNANAIRFVRVIAPRTTREDGRLAARLYLAAEQRGLAEDAAARLFAANDASRGALDRIARQLGIDRAEYAAAASGTRLDGRINATRGWVASTLAGRLPQIWIDEVGLAGVQTERSLNAALRRALRAKRNATSRP